MLGEWLGWFRHSKPINDRIAGLSQAGHKSKDVSFLASQDFLTPKKIDEQT